MHKMCGQEIWVYLFTILQFLSILTRIHKLSILTLGRHSMLTMIEGVKEDQNDSNKTWIKVTDKTPCRLGWPGPFLEVLKHHLLVVWWRLCNLYGPHPLHNNVALNQFKCYQEQIGCDILYLIYIMKFMLFMLFMHFLQFMLFTDDLCIITQKSQENVSSTSSAFRKVPAWMSKNRCLIEKLNSENVKTVPIFMQIMQFLCIIYAQHMAPTY